MNVNIELDQELKSILESVMQKDASRSYAQAVRKAIKEYGSFLFAQNGKHTCHNTNTDDNGGNQK
ncbi:MAG: hypothetical protein IJS08_15735 [Victivallales bacterium]|nr:hypothetical protein [Victivallales bacterium]